MEYWDTEPGIPPRIPALKILEPKAQRCPGLLQPAPPAIRLLSQSRRRRTNCQKTARVRLHLDMDENIEDCAEHGVIPLKTPDN